MLYIDLGIWMGIWNWLDWVMWLIYGGVPWWRTTLAGSGWWDWLMGTCHGGARLDRVMGLICGGAPWGARHRLDLGDGIDLWGHAIGAHDTGWIGWRHWFMGAHDIGWIGAMGLIHGGTPWGCVTLAKSGWWVWLIGAHITGWTGAMGLIYGGEQHWHWFMGTRHGNARLDRGDGIEFWGRWMGNRNGRCGWRGMSLEGSRRPGPGWRGGGGSRGHRVVGGGGGGGGGGMMD